MSHSNRHQFAPLTKSSKPLSGQRLSRVIAKASKDGGYSPNLPESLCVSIPFLESSVISENIVQLTPHILAMIEDTRDAIISEKRKESGCTEISDDDISIASCIAFLESSAKGSRVTSEYLSEWFKETYSVQAAEFIIVACKWGVELEDLSPEQLQVVENKINVLSGMFSGFASGKYSPEIPKCKAMLKFGEFLPEDAIDSRMSIYLGKAKKILEAKELELSSDALGF